jgi:hypothetical protein
MTDPKKPLLTWQQVKSGEKRKPEDKELNTNPPKRIKTAEQVASLQGKEPKPEEKKRPRAAQGPWATMVKPDNPDLGVFMVMLWWLCTKDGNLRTREALCRLLLATQAWPLLEAVLGFVDEFMFIQDAKVNTEARVDLAKALVTGDSERADAVSLFNYLASPDRPVIRGTFLDTLREPRRNRDMWHVPTPDQLVDKWRRNDFWDPALVLRKGRIDLLAFSEPFTAAMEAYVLSMKLPPQIAWHMLLVVDQARASMPVLKEVQKLHGLMLQLRRMFENEPGVTDRLKRTEKVFRDCGVLGALSWVLWSDLANWQVDEHKMRRPAQLERFTRIPHTVLFRSQTTQRQWKVRGNAAGAFNERYYWEPDTAALEVELKDVTADSKNERNRARHLVLRRCVGHAVHIVGRIREFCDYTMAVSTSARTWRELGIIVRQRFGTLDSMLLISRSYATTTLREFGSIGRVMDGQPRLPSNPPKPGDHPSWHHLYAVKDGDTLDWMSSMLSETYGLRGRVYGCVAAGANDFKNTLDVSGIRWPVGDTGLAEQEDMIVSRASGQSRPNGKWAEWAQPVFVQATAINDRGVRTVLAGYEFEHRKWLFMRPGVVLDNGERKKPPGTIGGLMLRLANSKAVAKMLPPAHFFGDAELDVAGQTVRSLSEPDGEQAGRVAWWTVLDNNKRGAATLWSMSAAPEEGDKKELTPESKLVSNMQYFMTFYSPPLRADGRGAVHITFVDIKPLLMAQMQCVLPTAPLDVLDTKFGSFLGLLVRQWQSWVADGRRPEQPFDYRVERFLEMQLRDRSSTRPHQVFIDFGPQMWVVWAQRILDTVAAATSSSSSAAAPMEVASGAAPMALVAAAVRMDDILAVLTMNDTDRLQLLLASHKPATAAEAMPFLVLARLALTAHERRNEDYVAAIRQYIDDQLQNNPDLGMQPRVPVSEELQTLRNQAKADEQKLAKQRKQHEVLQEQLDEMLANPKKTQKEAIQQLNAEFMATESKQRQAEIEDVQKRIREGKLSVQELPSVAALRKQVAALKATADVAEMALREQFDKAKAKADIEKAEALERDLARRVAIARDRKDRGEGTQRTVDDAIQAQKEQLRRRGPAAVKARIDREQQVARSQLQEMNQRLVGLREIGDVNTFAPETEQASKAEDDKLQKMELEATRKMELEGKSEAAEKVKERRLPEKELMAHVQAVQKYLVQGDTPILPLDRRALSHALQRFALTEAIKEIQFIDLKQSNDNVVWAWMTFQFSDWMSTTLGEEAQYHEEDRLQFGHTRSWHALVYLFEWMMAFQQNPPSKWDDKFVRTLFCPSNVVTEHNPKDVKDHKRRVDAPQYDGEVLQSWVEVPSGGAERSRYERRSPNLGNFLEYMDRKAFRTALAKDGNVDFEQQAEEEEEEEPEEFDPEDGDEEEEEEAEIETTATVVPVHKIFWYTSETPGQYLQKLTEQAQVELKNAFERNVLLAQEQEQEGEEEPATGPEAKADKKKKEEFPTKTLSNPIPELARLILDTVSNHFNKMFPDEDVVIKRFQGDDDKQQRLVLRQKLERWLTKISKFREPGKGEQPPAEQVQGFGARIVLASVWRYCCEVYTALEALTLFRAPLTNTRTRDKAATLVSHMLREAHATLRDAQLLPLIGHDDDDKVQEMSIVLSMHFRMQGLQAEWVLPQGLDRKRRLADESKSELATDLLNFKWRSYLDYAQGVLAPARDTLPHDRLDADLVIESLSEDALNLVDIGTLSPPGLQFHPLTMACNRSRPRSSQARWHLRTFIRQTLSQIITHTRCDQMGFNVGAKTNLAGQWRTLEALLDIYDRLMKVAAERDYKDDQFARDRLEVYRAVVDQLGGGESKTLLDALVRAMPPTGTLDGPFGWPYKEWSTEHPPMATLLPGFAVYMDSAALEHVLLYPRYPSPFAVTFDAVAVVDHFTNFVIYYLADNDSYFADEIRKQVYLTLEADIFLYADLGAPDAEGRRGQNLALVKTDAYRLSRPVLPAVPPPLLILAEEKEDEELPVDAGEEEEAVAGVMDDLIRGVEVREVMDKLLSAVAAENIAPGLGLGSNMDVSPGVSGGVLRVRGRKRLH